jgi:glycosyltransferase involved in cell wall biosynthesis
MQIAVAHEWLVRYAGSERVVEQLLEAFPGSRLLTTVLDPTEMPAALARAEPSFLQRIPGGSSHHEWLLPLMPLSWRLRERVSGVDAVVASSHACANAVRVAERIPLVSYCHTPMRYAWDFEAERERFPRPVRVPARLAMRGFRGWDRRVAERVTRFVANSHAVARRIATVYGRDADVVHPPVDTAFFTPGGEPGERFLYVGRLTGYKRPDLVVAAFDGLPFGLDVVGEGALLERLRAAASPNVAFHGKVGATELRNLYRRARALVYPVDEDFGIAMAEAQACGTPVIGLAEGGAVDIVEHGRTGLLVASQDVEEIRAAVAETATTAFSRTEIRAHAKRFSASRFRDEMRAIVTEVVAETR